MLQHGHYRGLIRVTPYTWDAPPQTLRGGGTNLFKVCATNTQGVARSCWADVVEASIKAYVAALNNFVVRRRGVAVRRVKARS